MLGERHPRYDDLAERIVGLSRSMGQPTLRATAYDLTREDLADLLASGPAVGVYVGHGRPVGWVGYAGLRAHHLTPGPGAPAGAIVSLTCRTASRQRTGLSFAEAMPLLGVAAAALGAVGPTLHTANARWALRITRALPTAATIGDLVVAVAPHDPHAAYYRLTGDPTAPLVDGPAFGLPRREEVAS